MRWAFSLLAAVLTLSGCGANFTTAYRTFEPVEDGPKNALIDAKQRALFVAPGTMSTMTGEGRRKMLVCAEPSPDALSAISSSLSASFGGLFPSGANVQAALAAALSETASQLGVRNATIQLLRDGLYRQCEAYMNGLIGADYYEQISNKYVNAMVALLAIEQLAPVNASAKSIRASGGGKVSTKTSVNVSSRLPAAGQEQDTADPEQEQGDGGGANPSPPVPNTNTPASGGASNTGTTEEAELDSSGSNEASADAVAPVTSVNFPSDNERETPEGVSRAVNTMVTWFLTKDTVDYCLRGLFLGKASDGGELHKTFLDVCERVIIAQMSQQAALTTNLSGIDYALATHDAAKIYTATTAKADEIAVYVTAANGSIDAAKLAKLVEKATIASPSTKAKLLRFTVPEKLRTYLRDDAAAELVDQLHSGIP